MFVRLKKYPEKNKTAIQVVENYRSKGKVRQKIVRHVGVARTDTEIEKLKELAEFIKNQIEEERSPRLFSQEELDKLKKLPENTDDSPLNVNLKNLTEEQRIITGIGEIYGQLYDMVNFDKLFKNKRVSKKVIKNLVLARLASAKSKLATSDFLIRDFGVKIKPEQIYRALDVLDDETIENIKKQTFSYTQSLFKEEVNVVFYDCTTLYFESFTQDDLKSFGYSKDNKFNQSQILLALAVTKQGLPVSYELFAGNFYEGHTLVPVIEKLKAKFAIKRIILVADSGLFNTENLHFLEENNIEFIVGARLKNLSKKYQTQILDNKDYIKKKKKDDTLRFFDIEYSETRRLIVSHSQKRGEKDRSDR